MNHSYLGKRCETAVWDSRRHYFQEIWEIAILICPARCGVSVVKGRREKVAAHGQSRLPFGPNEVPIMSKAMKIAICGLVGVLGLPGLAGAEERFINKGQRFVKVLSVERLETDDITRIKVRLYYWEPWFERKLMDRGRIGRLQISRYLLTWGQSLKWIDDTVQLRSKAVIRVIPEPVWNQSRDQWEPAPLKGKEKKDKKPGLPGAVEDIQVGGWLTITLQSKRTGELFASGVVVHQGFDKVIGKMP